MKKNNNNIANIIAITAFMAVGILWTGYWWTSCAMTPISEAPVICLGTR